MPKDAKHELKQHLNDKADATIRCIVKCASQVRKQSSIAHVFPSVEAQEAKINATQKVLYSLPNVAMQLEDSLTDLSTRAESLAIAFTHYTPPSDAAN